MEVSFTSFDVEFGGKHCPYDHLTVTDGDGTILINRLCGKVGGAAGYRHSPGYGYGYGNNSSGGNGNSSAVNGSGNGYGNISRRQRQAEDNNVNSSVNGSGNGTFSVNGNVSANGNVSEISLENILNKAIVSHTNVLIFTFATDGSVTGRGWSANWKSVTPGLHFTFGHSSIICPGCPKNPPYPGDQCYPTDDDDKCEYSITEEKDCNNCGCDDGPSSVGMCGQEKDEEKITFSCSESWPGIWKPVHESSVCNSSGKQSYH